MKFINLWDTLQQRFHKIYYMNLKISSCLYQLRLRYWYNLRTICITIYCWNINLPNTLMTCDYHSAIELWLKHEKILMLFCNLNKIVLTAWHTYRYIQLTNHLICFIFGSSFVVEDKMSSKIYVYFECIYCLWYCVGILILSEAVKTYSPLKIITLPYILGKNCTIRCFQI